MIKPLPFDDLPLVRDINVFLPHKGNASEGELMTQRLFMHRFKKPRTKKSMNFYGRSNDSVPLQHLP